MKTEKRRSLNGGKPKRFSTDDLMRNLGRHMVEDFRTVCGDGYHKDWDVTNIPKLRGYQFPSRYGAPPWLFKMEAQLEAIYKRYRFETDLYSDEELEQLTVAKFQALQLRLAEHQWRPRTTIAHEVIRTARTIIRQILDGADLEGFSQHCRFSTRATVGSSARDAYIDHKLADPITGSPDHCRWFKSHLESHNYLRFTISQCSPVGEPVMAQCESLSLVPVPKSYKSLRLIMPNTLIGSYYTYGLGKVLVDCLRDAGLDISKLQSVHKNLARKASNGERNLATADLSSASESFLWCLVCALLPRKWVRAVRFGRLSSYSYGDATYHYCSFMAMGIGFTFPLQTLLFYAIVSAICKLTGTTGTVSVYGDDLIYPVRIHSYVEKVFTDLGFQLNNDKTFADTDFRESCGGDYFRGVDVRPFSPEGSHRNLTGRRYEAFVYQLMNGLQERWQCESLPKTFAFLEKEVMRVTSLIKQVPFSYPDTSGFRVAHPVFRPEYSPVLCRMRQISPDIPRRIIHTWDHVTGKAISIAEPPFHGSREYCFVHLTKVARNRFVSFEQAYVYDYLRAAEAGERSEEFDGVFEAREFEQWLRMERWRGRNGVNKWFDQGRPSLRLFPLPKQPRNYRARDGRRLKRSIAISACKLTPERLTTTRTDSVSDWI